MCSHYRVVCVVLVASVLSAIPGNLAYGQRSDDLVVSLNPESQFVVSAPNGPFATSGLDFKSPSGSLSLADHPAPFNLLLANNPNQITFGIVGERVTVDGDLTLAAGWDQTGERDLTYTYGRGAEPIGPIPFKVEDYANVCEACARFHVDIDEDANFLIRGLGQNLTSLVVQSTSGSLVPPLDPGPFESVTATPQQVTYVAPSGGLRIDGDLTLGTKWAFGRNGSERDVTLTQLTTGSETPLTTRIPFANYPERSFIGLTFDEQHRLVLNGDGHPLTEVRLIFNPFSTKLEFDDTSFPFAAVDMRPPTNPGRIIYSASPLSPVTLDGSLAIPARYAPTPDKDSPRIEFEYDLADDNKSYRRVIGPDEFPAVDFPAVETPEDMVEEVDWPPIMVSLDDQDRFVITGEGHPLRRVTLGSVSHSLLPGDDPSPFEEFTAHREDFVSQKAIENVILDGSITLTTRWNREREKNVVARFEIDEVSRNQWIPLPRNAFPNVSDPITPFDGVGNSGSVEIYINEQHQFVLRGDDLVLDEVVLSSESNSLVPGDSAAPFVRFNENTPQRVHFAGDELVTISGEVVLSVGWNADGSRDIALGRDASMLPSWIYPTLEEPASPGDPNFVPGNNAFGGGSGFAYINEQGFIVIIGDINVAGIEITSVGGNLVPRPAAEAAGPFSFALSNTQDQITLGTLGSTVQFEGLWQTGIRYNGDSPTGDLFITWGDGPTPIAIPILANDPTVPEPRTVSLLLLGVVIMLRRRRH